MKDSVTFTIEGKKYSELMSFVEEHKTCKGCSAGEKFCFSFVPTMFGNCVTVSCSCGKKIDLTDSENW